MFPWHDAYWAETVRYCAGAGLFAERGIAPEAFAGLSPELRPPIYTHFDTPEAYRYLVIHKGLLEQYRFETLAAFRRDGTYVFGNPVFVVLARGGQVGAAADHLGPLDEYLATGRQPSPRPCPDRTALFDRWRGVDRAVLPAGTKRVAVISANGMGNFGDDLLAHATCRLIEQALGPCDIRVLAPPVDPRSVEGCDLVVIGGGGLLYDVGGGGHFYDNDLPNVTNYMAPLLEAQARDIPTFALGQGVTGITSALGRDIYRRVLSRCNGVSVRDRESARVLDEIGVTCPVATLPDLAFLLGPEARRATGRRARNPMPASERRPRVLVAVSDPAWFMGPLIGEPTPYQNSLIRFGETNRWFLSTYKDRLDIQFFVQSRDDLSFCEQVEEIGDFPIIRPDRLDLDQALAHYAEADLVVTSRLHSLVPACLMRKPVIVALWDYIACKNERLILESARSLQANAIRMRDYTAEELGFRIERFLAGGLPGISDEELARAEEAAAKNVAFIRRVLLQPAHNYLGA